MILRNNELIFQITCGCLLIMQTVARMWMTRNKPSTADSRFYHRERESFFVRLSGIAVALAYIYVFLPDTAFFHYAVPEPLRWSGAGLMLAGNSMFIAAHSALGKQWSAELEIQPGHELIVTGIYQFIRHPMYTGFILFGAGMVFLSANVLGCAYFAVVVVMITCGCPRKKTCCWKNSVKPTGITNHERHSCFQVFIKQIDIISYINEISTNQAPTPTGI